jgi:hypothetical protein
VLVGEWIGGEVWVVVCVGCGVCRLWCQWVEEGGLKRGVAASMGELQRGECVLVVRVGRQLGSGA